MQILQELYHPRQSRWSWLCVLMYCVSYILLKWEAEVVLKISLTPQRLPSSEHTQLFYETCNTDKQTAWHTHTHTLSLSFVGNMAGMWDCHVKGRGGSSLPECCYSGPHASASVSANERNSALFHLVSPDRELASPKTDAARGMEGWMREG